MPYKRVYPKKKKTGTKKAKAKMPKPVSKMTNKELMRKTPEQFFDFSRMPKTFTPLRFSFGKTLAGDGATAYSYQGLNPLDAYDPSGSVGARQAYLYDQLMALYTRCAVVRYRISLDYMDLSSVSNVPYYVYIAVNPKLADTYDFVTSPEDLLEHRESRIRPAYSLLQAGQTSTAGGRRRIKLEFDLARACGLTPAQFEVVASDPASANYWSTTTSGPGTAVNLSFGLMRQDGTALPVTVTGRFTVKIRMLCKLQDRKDVGTS